ncbi:MAG TPA: WXG100 family type VII secretion target [Nocardioides sp.]|nr:WXG100 family type VII secretion target [Nocardioides sp.]
MSASEMGQGEGTLGKGAGLVAGAKVDLDRISSRLDAQIHGLRGRWQGAGGTAFFMLHQAWTERQRTIVQALDSFERALAGTERDNVATDEAQSAAYARTTSRLG